MGRISGFIYGIISYLISFLALLYAIGFVGNLIVPKSIDSGTQGPIALSIIINLLLLSLFAVQHSVMARPQFKAMWTKIVPEPVERSTYIWLTSLVLFLLYYFWMPIKDIVWDVSGTTLGTVLLVLFFIGWGITFAATFMINHFDLFGLRQVYLNLKQRKSNHQKFEKRLLYKFVRHPIMTGVLIGSWATPTMTYGHLLFAIVISIYIYIAVKHFEEKDLVAEIGSDYIDYQKEVGMFFPGIGKNK